MELIQQINTVPLLNEATAEAHKWEMSLGKGRKGNAEKAFVALAHGSLELGDPQPHVYQLNFTDLGPIKPAISKSGKRGLRSEHDYDYYVVAVPLLLFPGRGAQYRLVESQFKIRSARKGRQPAFYRIFPESYWKPVLDWGGKLNLAVDSNLEWGAEVEQSSLKIRNLEGQLAGRVKNLNELSGFIKVLQFEFDMGRMEIESQFATNVAMWRLDSKKAIRGEKNMQFVFLVKVPKGVNQIRLEAAAQAEVEYDWLTAQVNHVLKHLSQSIKNAIKRRGGLPLQDFKVWTVALPVNRQGK